MYNLTKYSRNRLFWRYCTSYNPTPCQTRLTVEQIKGASLVFPFFNSFQMNIFESFNYSEHIYNKTGEVYDLVFEIQGKNVFIFLPKIEV